MAANIVIVEGGRVYEQTQVERLWFFPDCSEYLRYSPHFHMVYSGGFRTNFPLTHGFVIVMTGKLSIKDFNGYTTRKIVVRDQVWYNRLEIARGTPRPAPHEYAKMLRVAPVYASPKPIYG
jgi:hypothetical protein